jgi:signal transduction histidine kinase
MPRALRLFTCGALLASSVMIARGAIGLETLPPVVLTLLFLLVYVLLELLQVNLPSGIGISLGASAVITGLVLFGSSFAILLQAVGAVVIGLLLRAPREWLALNFANYVLSVASAGLVFSAVGGVVGEPFALSGLPLVLAVLALCLTQSALVGIVLSLYKARPLATSIREISRVSVALWLTTIVFSLSLAAAARAWGLAPAACVACALAVGGSLAVRRLARQTQGRMLAELVPPDIAAFSEPPGVVDSQQDVLVRLVSVMGDAAGLQPADQDALRWAALLHDTGLGESGIPDPTGEVTAPRSLSKKGGQESRQAHEHPLRASMRVGRVGNLVWVARILETHHEQYNGWGYPFGLQGEEIPVPAAILGLAEAYLALTGGRPSRPRGMGRPEALRYIRARSGEQFHPAAVKALEGSLETIKPDAGSGLRPGSPVADAVRRLRRGAAVPSLPPPPAPATPGAPIVGSDLWFRGTGGTRRFMTRLFARDPLRVFDREHELTAEWYRSLFDLGRVFSSSLSVRGISEQLAEAVHHLTTLPCAVHLVMPDGCTLEPVAARGFPEEVLPSLKQAIDEGLIGMALHERRPVTSVDVTSDSRAVFREQAAVLGVKSVLVIPLMVSEMSLGAVAVNSPTVRRFPPSEVRALDALGNLAAVALHNAVLYRKANDRLEQLNEAQAFLRTALDTVPVGIVTLETDGRLSLGNRQASEYLAALGLEVGPGAAQDIMAGLHRVLGVTTPKRALETGNPCGPDNVSAVVAGGERFFRVWASPLQDVDGVTTGVLVVLEDVSKSQRLEAEIRRTEKLAAIGEVAAKAAHEIRNPITSILGFLQLMGLYCPVRDEWGECTRYVNRASDEIGRLGEIARSMLTLAGPARPALAADDLSGPVMETIELLAGKASEQGVSLEGPAGPTGVTARFDSRQMRQVLLNLAQNALDAVVGPGGPVPGRRKVAVTLGYTRRDGRRLAFIQVRDNGPGVPDEDRTRLFTPFYTTKELGTGLGLPVSRSIVEAHNGTLDVRSGRGRGAVFEILLPASATARADDRAADASPEPDGGSLPPS